MSSQTAFSHWRDYAGRKTSCRTAPTEWMVESTNRCNLSCPMCTRGNGSLPPLDMSFEFYRHLIGSHPQVEYIWPHGFGEPLLHPRIFDFISHAKSLHKTVSLSINNTLLDEGRGKELLRSGLDYLVLAVDGTTADTYENNRRPAVLEDTEGRVRRFLIQKHASGSRLHVTVQMVRMSSTLHEVERFRKRWKHPAVDAVRVRDDLSGLPGIRLDGPRSRPGAYRPCFFLWRGPLFVQSRGTLIPCPYYHGFPPFGDLTRQSVPEAWNSEAMRALRAAHLRGDLSGYPVCAGCPRHQPHPILASAGFFITTNHIRRVLPRLEDVQRRLQWKLVE